MNLTKQKLILIPFLLFFITACDQNSSTISSPNEVTIKNSDSPDGDSNNSNSTDPNNIVFELGDSVCESGTCPEWAGSVFSKTPNGPGSDTYGSCSGTLVAENLFLTNKHCVPEELRFEGADCKGRFKVVLPATRGLSKVEVGCNKINNITQNQLDIGTIPDWVLLELAAPVNRRTPSQFTSNVATTDRVTLYPSFYGYDAGDDPLTGKIRPVNCNLKQSLNPNSDFPQIDFQNCDQFILAGNSGTGVFDRNGGMIGLMSHIVVDDTVRRHRDGLRQESRTGLGTSILFITEK